MSGMFDERGQALASGVFFFRANDPPAADFLIPGRLVAEEFPGRRMAAKLFLIRCRQLSGFSLLVGVDLGVISVPLCKGRQACGVHEAQGGELGGASNVDCAPDTSRLARGKPNLVADFVDAFADAVDPAEAERAVDCFRPRDAGPSGAPLLKADPKFAGPGVMLLQPDAPGRR